MQLTTVAEYKRPAQSLPESIGSISKQTSVTVEVIVAPEPVSGQDSAAAAALGNPSAGDGHLRDDVPPQLPYSLRSRRWSIFIIWTILILDSCVLPVSLFFILKYAVGWDDTKSKQYWQPTFFPTHHSKS